MCDLLVATWYHLKVVAEGDAGVTTANYYFSTLTENGERIPAPAQFPPGGAAGAGERAAAALVAAVGALALALLLLAAIVYKKNAAAACLRKGYEQGEVSEEEDKCPEKRDNHRNCQQVYTSSPIKRNLNAKDQGGECAELYEISPYATFSMSGGATGAGAGAAAGAGVGPGGGAAASCAGGTLRTFGRAEPAPLHAAPPRRPPLDAEEYTLSRAMTLMVRRSESDSESSGSPCAECNSSVSYRMPVNKVEESSRGTVSVSSGASAASGCAAGCAPGEDCGRGARHDKRRRPRRHAPSHNRHQQRHEQERRDFTIHV
ncbi:uncharacterized protein LOC119190622 [Manduca sexta]|uniref:uncharacterized protein LOC119190622 n=1 Tax=Manduca sexta TaxID=7130 RepID=UPI00188FAC04|nr:uncharacterized protein LOC119190622 [Manduca sexta]